MNLASVRNKAMGKAGKQILLTRKHSPTILVAVGAVGFVSTVVLASRATLKVSEIFDEADNLRAKSEEIVETHPEKYSPEDAREDGVKIKVQTAVKIVKLYAPAVAVGALTVVAFTSSHVILTRRNAALGAAYVAVDKSFKQYRDRVVGELGKDKDREFLFGTFEEQIEVDTDDGKAVKTVKRLGGEGDDSAMYARCFNKENKHWKYGSYYNFTFLQAQERYANERLNLHGYLSLNDVYKSLGFDPTKAGQIVGWTKSGGDGFVSFGIVENDPEGNFSNGDTDDVWLDFNVQGNILDAYSKG